MLGVMFTPASMKFILVNKVNKVKIRQSALTAEGLQELVFSICSLDLVLQEGS